MIIDKTTNFLGPIQKINLIAEYLGLKRILPAKIYNEDFKDWIEQIKACPSKKIIRRTY